MTCNYRTLATSGPFQVQLCRCCGGVSVHLGAFTVRLDGAALGTLHGALSQAVEQMRAGEGEVQPQPGVPGASSFN